MIKRTEAALSEVLDTPSTRRVQQFEDGVYLEHNPSLSDGTTLSPQDSKSTPNNFERTED